MLFLYFCSISWYVSTSFLIYLFEFSLFLLVSLDRGLAILFMRKDSVFNRQCWENWTASYKRMKLDYYLIPYKKVTQNGFELNVRPETTEFLKENLGSILICISLSHIFWIWIKTQGHETKNKWNNIKPKCFFTVQETIIRIKGSRLSRRRYL